MEFRAWNIKNKSMFQFNFWNVVVDKPIRQILRHSMGNWILLRFIGLHDKNGKGIYEGDIYEIESELGKPKNRWVIKWNEAYAQFEGVITPQSESGKVIGNIYENPELLN